MSVPWILVLKKIERSDRSVSVELVVDPRMPMRSKLEGIISDSTLAQKFVPIAQDAGHGFGVQGMDMLGFIRVLAAIKANDWSVFTSNAYSLGPNSDVVQTFYFEKAGNSSNHTNQLGNLSTHFVGNEVSNLDHRPTPLGASNLAVLFPSAPLQEPPIVPTPKAQPNPPVHSSSLRLPGPAVSSIVTIAGNPPSNSHPTLSSTIDHPLGEQINSNPASAARRSSIQSSLSSLSGSGEPVTDNSGAVARRTSISSSLSSLSSGDAYLFARKVAERERINTAAQEVKPPPPPPKKPVAPKAPKMTDDDAEATGLSLKTRAVLGKARRERGAIPKFVGSEDLVGDIILIPTKSTTGSATKASNPPATPPPPPPQPKVPAYLINTRMMDPLSSTPSPASSLAATPTSAGSSAGSAITGPPTPSAVRRPSVFGNRPPPAVPQQSNVSDPSISPAPAPAPAPPPAPSVAAPAPAGPAPTSSNSTSVMDKIRRFSNPFSNNSIPPESAQESPVENVEEPKKKMGLSFLKAPRAPTFNGSASSATGSLDNMQQQKNAEHFRKLKEEEAREQKKKLEDEASMDAETQRRLRESEQQAQAHEASKTAHYSRLGSAFAKGGAVLATATAPRSRASETNSTLAAVTAQVQADSSSTGAADLGQIYSQSNRSGDESSTRVSFADDPRYASNNFTEEVNSVASSSPSRGGSIVESIAPSAQSSGLVTAPTTSLSSAASSVLPAARPVSKGLSFLKAPRTAVSDPKAASSVPEWQQRNNEHFKKLAEDEERERRRKADEEASLDAESLRRLREAESQAQAHDASKTAHYARLGSAFARTTLTRTNTGPAKR